MKLYEIDGAILACVDLETGEIIDEERLDALKMWRTEKIDNIAALIKNILALNEGIKAEEKTLLERRKQNENTIERLKAYLDKSLCGEKFETPRNRISWRRSESVCFTDESAIPEEYKKYVTETKIDKVAIKDAFKSGVIVPGAELVSKSNIQIK